MLMKSHEMSSMNRDITFFEITKILKEDFTYQTISDIILSFNASIRRWCFYVQQWLLYYTSTNIQFFMMNYFLTSVFQRKLYLFSSRMWLNNVKTVRLLLTITVYDIMHSVFGIFYTVVRVSKQNMIHTKVINN